MSKYLKAIQKLSLISTALVCLHFLEEAKALVVSSAGSESFSDEVAGEADRYMASFSRYEVLDTDGDGVGDVVEVYFFTQVDEELAELDAFAGSSRNSNDFEPLEFASIYEFGASSFSLVGPAQYCFDGGSARFDIDSTRADSQNLDDSNCAALLWKAAIKLPRSFGDTFYLILDVFLTDENAYSYYGEIYQGVHVGNPNPTGSSSFTKGDLQSSSASPSAAVGGCSSRAGSYPIGAVWILGASILWLFARRIKRESL